MTMTTKYTQDEWLAIFDQAEQNLPSTPVHYKARPIGSAAFAQTIDHTLLKLEATAEQVDTLCEEAKRYHFKVCEFLKIKTAWFSYNLCKSVFGSIFMI